MRLVHHLGGAGAFSHPWGAPARAQIAGPSAVAPNPAHPAKVKEEPAKSDVGPVIGVANVRWADCEDSAPGTAQGEREGLDKDGEGFIALEMVTHIEDHESAIFMSVAETVTEAPRAHDFTEPIG